jgi:hypothetical protein
MTQIIPAGSFNPASLGADDLYIQIQNPPGFIVGVPTDVIGIVGTAGWGPVNMAQHMGNPFDAMQTFGPISAASLTDPYDMPTDLAIAFGQAASAATLEAWGVRVSDGTDVAATGTLNGAATSASITGTSAAGVAADTIALTFTSSAIAGSPLTITYTVPASPSPTPTTIAAGVAALINATAALSAVGIFATSLVGVVSIYQPTALSPQATVSRAVTGTGTFTLGTGAAVTAGLVLSGIFTGSVGNALTATLATGAGANTTSATIALPTLGISELYPNLPNATFFTALANAIAQGINGVRGPSQIVKAGTPNIAVAAPTAGTSTFSGGTDGRAGVVTATLLGSNTAIPATGLYALQGVNPAVGISWIVGSTDQALPASLVAFGRGNGISTLFPFPTGTSTAVATGLSASIGQHDPSFGYVKDWVYFYDPLNNVTRLVPPTAYVGGMAATLSPEQGIGNKPVQLCLGTERNNPVTGNIQPYSISEIAQLTAAGIIFITNPIPAGNIFGTRHGQITSLNPVTAGMEYWRMTSFLARSIGTTMGQFVDALQSQQPNDPLRNAVRNQFNTFLDSLKGANGSVGIIDDFSVICAFNGAPNAIPGNGVNTPASIGAHYLYALLRVRYLSVVRFFIVSLQGGTVVVTVGATPGQQLQSN